MREKLTLTPQTIDLWLCDPLNITDASLLSKYKALLTDDEKRKQQRYKFAKDRHDALITRAFVRDLLSYYKDHDPIAWRFSAGEKGKPTISQPHTDIEFNLSHTKGLIICAVTTGNDIGCDVENLTRDNAIIDIADRYFSRSETKALHKLPTSQQVDRFYDLWTLKESYIKAVGLGLSIPLKDFSFTINESNHSRYNNRINLSLSESLKDDPKHWHSWLFFHSEAHRIAISLRTPKVINNKNAFSFRFFQSIPLVNRQQIDLTADTD